MNEIRVAGIRLTNPDKILYPEQGITKKELADYQTAVAPLMLPHVAKRPITLVRCPTGRQKKCFYQRHAGAGLPAAIRKVRIPGFDKPYLYIVDAAGLVSLVQVGVLEIHPWSVTVDRPERPDRLIIDLDPGEGLDFGSVVEAAIEVRHRLAERHLSSFVRTTGGKGLHVVAPIEPDRDWAAVKSWARRFAEEMAADSPGRYVSRMALAERAGRIFIDYLRNDPTATAIGSYSTRARPGAPVALPLDWAELEPGLDPQAFTVRTVPALLEKRAADPWAGLFELRQPLP